MSLDHHHEASGSLSSCVCVMYNILRSISLTGSTKQTSGTSISVLLKFVDLIYKFKHIL